jgi:hypothetical protein
MQSSNQFDRQSNESYNKQLFATKVFISAIDKCISIPDIQSSFTMTHTKGVIIHGGPGTGKTHIAKLAIFYALSKGLKIISSSILGVRAYSLDGTHLHSLFCWKPQRYKSRPFRTAVSALDRMQKTTTFASHLACIRCSIH